MPLASARFVEVFCNVANRNIDFVAEGYDMAIRAGALEDSTLVARKLEDAPLAMYASPDYLARHGTPKVPSDLEKHTLLGFVRPSTGRPLAFLCREKDGSSFEIPPGPMVRCSDDFLGCVSLAKAGAGIVQAFRFICEPAVQDGQLVEVLKPYAGASRQFSLLMPARRVATLAVRMFADALVEAVRAPPSGGAATAAGRSRSAPSRPRTRSSRTRRSR